MILEGIVMPVDELNANGWGIHSSEITNTIASLKQSVVRLCPEKAHSCDFAESKKHEIGMVKDAWFDGKYIRAKTEILSEKAKSLIRNREIAAWSVYGQGDQHGDGFVQNYLNKSLTLVADPAWKSAQFSQVAASTRFMLANPFKEDTMAPDIEEDKFMASFDKKVNEKGESLKKEFQDLVASKDKQISDLSTLVTAQADAIKTLQASVESLLKDKKPEEKKPEEKKPEEVFASKDDLKTIQDEIKSEKDIQSLIASAMETATETAARNTVIEQYKVFAASRGLKIEDTIFEGKTSKMIAGELAIMNSLSASVPEPVYQSIPDEFADTVGKLTVGVPDGKGGWRA